MLKEIRSWWRGKASTKRMVAFRQNLLEQVADTLCDPSHRQMQQALKLWNYSDAVPHPARESLHLNSETGTLTFRVAAGEHQVLFSIYFMFGRLYTGAYVPQALLQQQPSLTERLSLCMDGHPASSIRSDPSGVLFDWWFRDGPMAADTMLAAWRSPLGRSALADFVVLMSVHMYWSLMHVLVDSLALPSLPSGLSGAEHLIDLHTRGRAIESLSRLLQIRGVSVISVTQQAQDRFLLLVASEHDSPADLDNILLDIGVTGTVIPCAA